MTFAMTSSLRSEELTSFGAREHLAEDLLRRARTRGPIGNRIGNRILGVIRKRS